MRFSFLLFFASLTLRLLTLELLSLIFFYQICKLQLKLYKQVDIELFNKNGDTVELIAVLIYKDKVISKVKGMKQYAISQSYAMSLYFIIKLFMQNHYYFLDIELCHLYCRFKYLLL